ncbi:hypothetical protein E6C67_11430 [Azospirillum sp. TSA2s]|uniref:hypothetical protein n=1 Tax=Azospirillum sp. TSA2s TaxID=709810 RepID=UPI0010AAE2FE|nr:hypothetical protein [Azospirillum sp. TSA2s]QCG94521.1 hypothetical protein E6C67_11430 [Azospirillum sp. TSA2s]
METNRSGEYISDIHFIRTKMFIRTTHKLPVIVNNSEEHRRQRERSTRLRRWDDDGGAQPQEHPRD